LKHKEKYKNCIGFERGAWVTTECHQKAIQWEIPCTGGRLSFRSLDSYRKIFFPDREFIRNYVQNIVQDICPGKWCVLIVQVCLVQQRRDELKILTVSYLINSDTKQKNLKAFVQP